MCRYQDIDKYTRIYTDIDEEGIEYQYSERTTIGGLAMGNKYIDVIEELQSITGLSESEVKETLIAETLERLL